MMGENNEVVNFSIQPGRNDYPMCFVSQSDAKEFCAWLGINYRLPTVYEWMYAAKGGNPLADFATSNGDIRNTDALDNVIPGNYRANIQGFATETTSTKDIYKQPTVANGYGLRDMSGSVYEWTYFIEEDQAAGSTLPNNGFRYIMGGSYGTTNFSGAAVWNKGRISYSESVFAADLGFRVLYSSNRAQSIATQEVVGN
jgi:formylglycine-generating enzyme required for sulfatase activity